MSEIVVEELAILRNQDLTDIEELLRVLSPNHQRDRDFIDSNLVYQIERPEVNAIFVARSVGHIVGKASVHLVQRDLDRQARVEDVSILEDFRGKGIVERFDECWTDWALDKSADHLELNSNRLRVPANKAYQRLGFEFIDTNVRRKDLN